MNKQDRFWFFSSLRWLGPALLVILALLVLTAITAIAQGEDLDGIAPEAEPEIIVLSETVTPNGVTTQVVFPTTADTYIASNNPNTNYGSSTWLRLGYNLTSPNNGAERIFLRFDLSSIPSNAVINWARFRIFQHSATPAGDGDMGVQSRHLVSSWNEYAVTWSGHQPDWGGVIDTSWVPATLGWLEGDVTDLVKEWVSGQHANNGVLLMGDERVQERQRNFYSRESGGIYYPRLTVDYSIFVDNQPPVVSVESLPQYSGAKFNVKWSGYDPGGSGIDYYDVQYRVAGQTWINWLNNTGGTSADFIGGANGVRYEFRARGVDKSGNVQPWSQDAQAGTTVDSIVPSATVNALPPYIFSPAFSVSWTGTDNLSGIKCYDVEYREFGGAWQDWQTCVTATSVQVTGAQEGVTYELRARATDNAGNVQPWPNNPQTYTTISTAEPVAEVLPFASPVTLDPNITVRWTGWSSPGSDIDYYDINYRYGIGSWVRWLSGTKLTSDIFVAPQPGQYCFEARAADTIGRVADFKYLPQACIVLDTDPPRIVKRLHIPFIWKDAFD